MRCVGGKIGKNSYGKALEIQKRYAATGDPSYNRITQAIKNAKSGVTKGGTIHTLVGGAVSFYMGVRKKVKKLVKKVVKWFKKIFDLMINLVQYNLKRVKYYFAGGR